MFGRDFNPAYLFQACNVEVEESGDSNSEDETVIEPHEGTYNPPVNADEWMENLDSYRNSECEVARTNIAQDQARQKQIFDAKVQRNRSNIEESDNVSKKLPGTKAQPKYLGPYEVQKVTKSHVIITDKLKKPEKVLFHLTKKYLQRNAQCNKAPTTRIPVITSQICIQQKVKCSNTYTRFS